MSCSKSYRVTAHMDIDSCEIQNLKRHVNLDDPIVAINNSRMVLSATQAAKSYGIARPSILDVDRMQNMYPDLDILWVPQDKWGKPESKSKRISSFKILNIVQDYADRKGGFNVEINSLDDLYLDLCIPAENMVDERKLGDLDLPRLSEHMFMETGAATDTNDIIQTYIDSSVTNGNTYLLMGGICCQEISNEIIRKTGFKVSFGIGENKTVAKVATSLNRPRGITVLTKAGFFRRTESVPVTKITGLGGDRGANLLDEYGDDFTISDLREMDSDDLEECVGFELARKVKPRSFGIDPEPVVNKTMSQSLNCGKTLEFNNDAEYVEDEITKLCEEMIERNFDEEVPYHDRIGVRFRMHVESWFVCHPNYSCFLSVTPNEFNYMDGDDMAEKIIRGFRHDGFKIGKFFAKKLTLSVAKFADPPANW